MINEIHTVLGATGATGIALVKELQSRNFQVRTVQRSQAKKDIEFVQANLLIPEETFKAIKGSTYVYLCAAQPYKAKVWEKNWPVLMQNVIDACSSTNAKLVFFDNIYMYGPAPLSIPFDENHSQKPVSKKGMVRKKTANLLQQAIEDKKVEALIARSADFYGPNANNSMVYVSFLENMMKHKAPMIIAKPGIKHTYANTTDNARAMVKLALEPSAYGQVWHLPVSEGKTPEELTQMFNKALGYQFKPNFISPFIRKILSLFIPILKEVEEMQYQFENEYNMSFEKFKRQFPDFEVTPYEKGIMEMIQSFKKQ